MSLPTSPDGRWTFENGVMRSGEIRVPVCEMDFFERWTFARFLPGGALALAFETSQPWSESGSYGDPYWGVQVVAPTPDGGGWELVALEYDSRHPDESFEPLDVTWHRRGVLAWLEGGILEGQVLEAPRGAPRSCFLPERNSDFGLLFSFWLDGAWHALEIDPDGRFLRAVDGRGADLFDLELRLHARDGGPWEPLEIRTP